MFLSPGLIGCGIEPFYSMALLGLTHRFGATTCEQSLHFNYQMPQCRWVNSALSLRRVVKLESGTTTRKLGPPPKLVLTMVFSPWRLDPQWGLHPGIWNPTGATHECLDTQWGLHPGIWTPTGAISRCLDPQTGEPASHQLQMPQCWTLPQPRLCTRTPEEVPMLLPNLPLTSICLGSMANAEHAGP